VTPEKLLMLSEWLRDLALNGKPESHDARTCAMHLALAAEHKALALKIILRR
jgi:hypothetical protein